MASRNEMTETARRWHRVLVDRIAQWPGLRGRTGTQTSWSHYERHARAWTRAAQRHVRARARASGWAGHGPATVAPGWQAAIARFFGRDDSGRRGR
jgi:hypothetical protein